jgi:hypothetical protein
LAELTPDHFDADRHRNLRAHLVGDQDADSDLLALIVELKARAEADAIDEETGKQALLKLRARHIRREIADADDERTKELQHALQRIRAAVGEAV